jgi:hypothetical protein
MADLPAGFELSEASHSDLEKKFWVFQHAMDSDELFSRAFKEMGKEALHEYIMRNLATAWRSPSITIYKITENTKGYLDHV